MQPQAVVELRLAVWYLFMADRTSIDSACAAQSFGARERHNRRRQPLQAGPGQPLHRHHADEIGGAQAAAKPRRAGGRQHVVRSGGVVAGRLRGEGADEDGAGGDRPLRQRFAIDDQMLGRDAVGERHRFVGVARSR